MLVSLPLHLLRQPRGKRLTLRVVRLRYTRIMRFPRALFALLVATILIAACQSPTAPEIPNGTVRITGTVQYYTIEGGFWAVRGDDDGDVGWGRAGDDPAR